MYNNICGLRSDYSYTGIETISSNWDRVQTQFILRLITPGFGAYELEDHNSHIDLIATTF